MIKYFFLLLSCLSFATAPFKSEGQKKYSCCNGSLLMVYGNLIAIDNGDTTPSYIDNTVFLSCQVVNETSLMHYSIVNDGTTALHIAAISITGMNSADFQIISMASNLVSPGASTSFTVLFDPSAIGLRIGTVEISSDDSVNPLYAFSIQGYGLDYVECGYNAFEEVIVNQDFEPGSSLPIWNYTIESGTATVTGGTAYAETGIPLPLVPRYVGTKSLQVNNSNCIILLAPINTLNIRDASFNFRLASYARTPSEGSENGDIVSVAISSNGGNSWSNEIEITGSSQAKWSFLSGTGTAVSTYSGTDIIVSFTPISSGFLTTQGYSTIKLTGLPKTSDLRVRLTVVNNNTNELWVLDDIKLLARKQASTVWDGTHWSNGVPNNFTKAILAGNYSTLLNGNLTTCKCQINNGNNLLIESNSFLSSESDITNLGGLQVEDGGIILQKDDFALNSGFSTIKRAATIRMLDYVYWSSPLEQFSLNLVSPNTGSGYLWKWNPLLANPNGGVGFWTSAAGDLMEKGKGYIVRGPSGFGNVPQVYTAHFSGATINNGLITTMISRGAITSSTLPSYTSLNGIPFSAQDDNWNLVGNPYPSALDVTSFLYYNAIENPVIEGSVRLWTHGTLPSSAVNPFYNSYQYNYTASDYITHNGTATLSGPNGFNGFIGSCQGFFVLMNEGASANALLTFKNSMRTNSQNSNTQFYKNAGLTTFIEKHRIWLDLVNDSNFATRTVVGYLDNATNQKDVLYDAYTKLDGNQNFYSVIGDEKVCIQGRPLPFDSNDSVSLGYSIPVAGNYTIAIGALDGLFATNQGIFLEDTLLQIFHDLKQSPYSFTSASGTFNNRFVLRYQTSNLAAVANAFEDENVSISVNSDSNSITINSHDLKLSSFVVYDLLGRVLLDRRDLNENFVVLKELHSNNQVLLVCIRLEDGVVVTKKIIY
ncbi:MAG: choice-of-anchor D domain-containing protein [Flavobacteriaceae bacterium]|nr:choice-of-anchor D domain-containing protein [Flavobacteriaceae bacterium]